MKSLSLRLSKVASYVDKGAYVADVGADHGLLTIYLANEGIVSYIEAIENKKSPFSRLAKAVEENVGDREKVSLSFSSGLEDLDHKINEVIIAGMGGRLISSILNEHKEKLANVDTLIIDAHSEWDIVLLTAARLGYKVEEGYFFYEDDVFYSVWKLKKTDEDIVYDKSELLFGPKICQKEEKDLKRFISEKKKQYEELLRKDIPTKRKEEVKEALSLLEEMQNENQIID